MESRTGQEPSTSYSRKSSFLARQAQNRPSSADHIITIENFNKHGGGHTYKASEVLPAAAAALSASAVGAITAVGVDNAGASSPGYAASVSSAAEDKSSFDSEPELEAPFLQNEHQPGGIGSKITAADDTAAQATYVVSANGVRPVTPQNLSAFAEAAAAGTLVVPVITAEQAAALQNFQRQLSFAYGLSWIVNILLLVAKLYAYYISQSKAVLASAADSAVDLVSQVVIAYADWKIKQQDPRFPVGQARLEAIGVLACACIMSVASFEVINTSVEVLITTWQTGVLPELELGLVMYIVLGSATVLKLVCWLVCGALASKSDSMVALAEDHLNDIMSNMCAIITAVAAGFVPNGWWIDPVGAVAISLYIVVRWLAIAKQQVDKIVGRGAPEQFIQQLEELANSHHEAMGLDVIRAYHFGARYIVEMEVVLPANMSVRDGHDISLELQHKVEQFEEVERAFVHVDYMRRDGLEHKVERELAGRSMSAGSGSRHGKTTPDGEGGDVMPGTTGVTQRLL